ncbi:MAG: hypothetical protein B6242_12930 [Anaerolineaceae bacterium 4572_78]|nr:MAG: hypothetical protein B6242_12930 [Anaerolineaceae bacterium 4572_78]
MEILLEHPKSLWFDDIITVHLAKLPFVMGLDGLLGQGIQLTPFYHLVVKTWLLIGDNQTEWFLRFPGVCFSLVSLPLMYKLGKLYVGHTTGLVAMALIAINPYQIWYAHEVKIYSALVVASIGAMYAFGIYLKRHDKSSANYSNRHRLGADSTCD